MRAAALALALAAATPARGAALLDTALAPESKYLAATAALRAEVLENPGPHHRAEARSELIWLLLLRQEGPLVRGGLFQQAIEHPDAKPPLPPGLAALFQKADDPKAAQMLADRLRGAAPAAERLVAANSLELTGVIPGPALVDQVLAAFGAERDRVVRLEDMLVLATFAERSRDAFQRFKKLLLTEPDCGLVEATTLSLPSEDLRYVLFKRVGGDRGRAAELRRWIRYLPAWEPCK